MVRMMKCLGLALAVCLMAAPSAPAAGILVKRDAANEQKRMPANRSSPSSPWTARFSEKPQGEEIAAVRAARPALAEGHSGADEEGQGRQERQGRRAAAGRGGSRPGPDRGASPKPWTRSSGREKKSTSTSITALTMRGLALAAGASRISVTPTAIIMITGFNAESPYLRGLLDKIGVKPDFITCGEYKSAAEMFMRKGPSPRGRAMTNWLLDSLYESYPEDGGPGTRREARAGARSGSTGRSTRRSRPATGDHRQRPAPPGLRGRAAQESSARTSSSTASTARRSGRRPSISPRPWGCSSSGPSCLKGEEEGRRART